ncbi:MAG: phosphoribosylformylglycinamidine synthase II [Armatimonadetes bacterium CG2_30_59_28]|nr:MAG: phosphoribosylformylglycinamidine synthase II [Armatimonadetes bacterium CG2_30_59_28]
MMLDKALALGMKEKEYEKVVSILGRAPTETELAMYSVEWSEHCGYPRSRPLLKLFPKEGKYSAQVGEDAGGIEIEPGLMIVFKMESHNHPSQVEPKHGAATGVGGIVRDIFTCGARPIACLDSLRFGDLKTPLARYLFHGVVEGISFYGNCIGVPTVAGEVGFNPCYRGNCLVGVMSVGVVRTADIVSGIGKGVGNPVIYFGNSTGRDGIGGCSILASHEFGEGEEKRPTVQIGDPFTEKCLIEACLEALKTGAIVSLKDMGAAGLTCTTCEQAAAGGVGMEIDIGKVPLREADMESFEIMMSESQERMLGVIEKGREAEIISILEKWDLNGVVIGRVTDDGQMRVLRDGVIVAEMPAASLADPPTYYLPSEEPSYLRDVQAFDFSTICEPDDFDEALRTLLTSPDIAHKGWVFEQYDHMVQTNTVVLPGAGDAAVLRIKESSGKGIAVTTDCNSRYCFLDPYVGAQIAVAEAARNVVCVGAEPAGITDCLCFGNPEKPDRFYPFKRAVEGIADACAFFELPVVSGNVSFYNETVESGIHPTPIIGLVGVLEDVERRLTMAFRNEGDLVILLGDSLEELGGSEHLYLSRELEAGKPPALDLNKELSVQRCCLRAAQAGLLSSAHDCSEGGLAVAIAESCMTGGHGVALRLESHMRRDALLFGETQSRIVVSMLPCRLPALQSIAAECSTPLTLLGSVEGDRLTMMVNDLEIVNQLVAELDNLWRGAIACLMK